jgi:hypothetical protein
VALCEKSWPEKKQKLTESALADVRKIGRAMLESPAVAGVIESIATRYEFGIATLNKEGISGSSKTVQRQVNDFGQIVTAEISTVEISIPFTGNRDSLLVAPNTWANPPFNVEIWQNCLVFTVPDDDNAQRNVDQVSETISRNLNALRSQIAEWPKELRTLLQQEVDKRVANIRAEQERDKKLSFRIDRK